MLKDERSTIILYYGLNLPPCSYLLHMIHSTLQTHNFLSIGNKLVFMDVGL
jgi:hypothetical protein